MLIYLDQGGLKRCPVWKSLLAVPPTLPNALPRSVQSCHSQLWHGNRRDSTDTTIHKIPHVIQHDWWMVVSAALGNLSRRLGNGVWAPWDMRWWCCVQNLGMKNNSIVNANRKYTSFLGWSVTISAWKGTFILIVYTGTYWYTTQQPQELKMHLALRLYTLKFQHTAFNQF